MSIRGGCHECGAAVPAEVEHCGDCGALWLNDPFADLDHPEPVFIIECHEPECHEPTLIHREEK